MGLTQRLMFQDSEPPDQGKNPKSTEVDSREGVTAEFSPLVLSNHGALGAAYGFISVAPIEHPAPLNFSCKNLEISTKLPEHENSCDAAGHAEEETTSDSVVKIVVRNSTAGELFTVTICGAKIENSLQVLYEVLDNEKDGDSLVSSLSIQRALELMVQNGARLSSNVGMTPEGIAASYQHRLSPEYTRQAISEIVTISRLDGKARELRDFAPEALKSGERIVWIDLDLPMPTGILDREAIQRLVEARYPSLFTHDGNKPRGRVRDFEFFDVRLYEQESDAQAIFAVRRKKVGVFVGENLFVTVHDGAAFQIRQLQEQYKQGVTECPKEFGAGSIFLDLMFESAKSADRILDSFEQSIEDIETHYSRRRRFPSELVLTHEFPRIREGTDYMAAKFLDIDSCFGVISGSTAKAHFQKMFGELDPDTAKQDIEYVQGQVASRGRKALRLRDRIDYLVSTHNTVVNTRAETIQAKLAIIAGIAIPLSIGPSIAQILQDPKPGGVATLVASAAISLGLFGWGVWKRALHI